MFSKIYPCGATFIHEESQIGIKFRCTGCNNLYVVQNNIILDTATKYRWWKILLRFLVRCFLPNPQQLDKQLPAHSNFTNASCKNVHGKTFSSKTDSSDSNITSNSSQKVYVQTPSTKKYQPVLRERLDKYLSELVSKAWINEENRVMNNFTLETHHLLNLSLQDTVYAMLGHARKFAPGLQVPFFTPRIMYTSMDTGFGGLFESDEEGYVTLKVGREFEKDYLATCAVLAHELCHYILFNSGVHKDNTKDNEEFTDVCMFVVGFGTIFLSGYKRKPALYEYSSGHRLGYLTDTEYNCLNSVILSRRMITSDENILPTKIEDLFNKLLCHFPSRTRLEENILFYKKRYPHLSYYDLLDKMLHDLER